MTALLLLCLLAGGAFAQAPLGDPLWTAYKSQELVTARRLAEEELRLNPRSARAHLVLGYALAWEEGRHAAARHHLERAERLSRVGPEWVNQDALWNLAHVTELMDDRPRHLELLRTYQERYGVELRVNAAWSLLKLKRYDEARAAAQVGIDSEFSWMQGSGLEAMCAIEAELLAREAAYVACKAAFEHARSEGTSLTVPGYNASEAAAAVLRLDEARRYAREARSGDAGSAANPHERLLLLALISGRGGEALDEVRALLAWSAKHPPEVRDLSLANADGLVAQFLLAMGRSERGLVLIDRALRTPDRAGLTSANPQQAEGTHLALRLMLRRLERARRAEEASTRGLLARLAYRAVAWLPDPADVADRARLRGTLEDRRRLERTFRVYGFGGLFLQPWLIGELTRDLGPGVYRVALDGARAAEDWEGLAAHYDALAVDADFARGRWRVAVEGAEATLAGLPEDEVMLRARVAALGGASAWRLGDVATALRLYQTSLGLDPGTVRRLGLAIPATVSVSGADPVAVVTAAMLRRSPRFVRAQGGFQVVVSGSGDAVRVCLRDPLGGQIACSDAGVADSPADDRDRARHHALRFTERAFALPVQSSLLDLDSLDGRLVRSSASDRMKAEKILEAL